MARHSGLGKGLGSLIPQGREEKDWVSRPSQAPEEQALSPFREVPIDALDVNINQPRKGINSSDLESLAASIQELGVLQPILVRKAGGDRYEIVAGERRWRAARAAKLSTVPVLVRDVADVNSLEQALVENLHRQDLNPLDEAVAYRQLIDDFGMRHEDVGRRVGKSRTAVSNLLRLTQLPAELQKLVRDGSLSEGHARALLGCSDEAFQKQLAGKVVREGLSVRAVEEAVRFRADLSAPKPVERTKSIANPASAAALEWEERLGEYLDTRVKVTAGANKGRIVIDFADLEDLDRVATVMVDRPDRAVKRVAARAISGGGRSSSKSGTARATKKTRR